LDSEARHDLDAMAAACTAKTKIVFIANPNNPTGTVVDRVSFEAFLSRLPESAVLVLDEAYFEFARAYCDDYPSSQDYLSHGRVVGLRTFSKAYGMAGMRVGYGFFPTWLADGVNRVRAPFNVNCMAQAAGAAAISDTAHLKKTIDGTREGLKKLNEIFSRVGAKVAPSFANFVWADLGQPARPIFDALLAKGIIVRPGDVLGNPNALRVSVGTPDELEMFEAALVEVMKAPAIR